MVSSLIKGSVVDQRFAVSVVFIDQRFRRCSKVCGFPPIVVSDRANTAEEPELRLVRKADFSTLLSWSPTVDVGCQQAFSVVVFRVDPRLQLAATADRFAKTPQV